MSKQPNYFSIGVFTLVAILIAVVSVVLFGGKYFRQNTVEFVVTFKQSVNGLREGSKVKYNGIEVGNVQNVYLYTDTENETVYAPTIISIDLDVLAYAEGRELSPELVKDFLNREVMRGLVAKLDMDSIVTGMLFVDLNFSKENGFVLNLDRYAQYPSIPTLTSGMETLKDDIQRIVSNLANTDFKGLVDELRDTVAKVHEEVNALDPLAKNLSQLAIEIKDILEGDDIQGTLSHLNQSMLNFDSLMATVNTQADPLLTQMKGSLNQLEASLREIQELASNARSMTDPSDSFYMEAHAALSNFADATEALRSFLDYLERNPKALITGRATTTEGE